MRIPKSKRLLFVWGTLQSYAGNHHYIENASGEFVGEAQMVEESAMCGLAMNIFPGCEMRVCGELWLVDSDKISDIDNLEGYRYERHHVGGYYQQPVTVRTENGDLHSAIAYTNDVTFKQLAGRWGEPTIKYRYGTDYRLGTIKPLSVHTEQVDIQKA